LLWLTANDSRLNRQTRSLIVNASEVYVSSAGIWEVAIKSQLGKIKEDAELVASELEASGLLELHVSHRHAVAAGKLPLFHRDPFDRLLVAQAICEPMRFVTADVRLAAYSDLVVTI
jgi:PIN domain nuclease of toxin-antitoxin system